MQDIVPVVGAPIPAGLRIDADMEYLSMPFKLNALVTTDGLSISARVTALPVSLGVLLCHFCPTLGAGYWLHARTERHGHEHVRQSTSPAAANNAASST